jgi:DNA-binding NarL/FixJ family response regulator
VEPDGPAAVDPVVSGSELDRANSQNGCWKASDAMKHPDLTVLLVDDSVFVRRVLGQLLKRHPRVGRVFEGSDAAEGYSLFKVCRPDVVVLDLELPDKPGLEILKLIKSAAPSCIVIVLTTLNSPEVRAECLRLGADWFLAKDPGLLTVSDVISQCRPGRNSAPSGKRRNEETKSGCPPRPQGDII